MTNDRVLMLERNQDALFRQGMLRCLVWLVLLAVYSVVTECNLANRGLKSQLLQEQLLKLRLRRAMEGRGRPKRFSLVSEYKRLSRNIDLFIFSRLL